MLRHLTRRPAHGYELRKRVERTTGVRLNNNSLYPLSMVDSSIVNVAAEPIARALHAPLAMAPQGVVTGLSTALGQRGAVRRRAGARGLGA